MIDDAWISFDGAFVEFEVPGSPCSRYGAAAIDLGSAGSGTGRVIRAFAERSVAESFGVLVTYQ